MYVNVLRSETEVTVYLKKGHTRTQTYTGEEKDIPVGMFKSREGLGYTGRID